MKKNFYNADPPQSVYPEDSLSLPWLTDPEASWIDYRCWVEVDLDAGMALHKPLPQSDPAADTLASTFLGGKDFASSTDGVNLKSKAGGQDIVQRMATSTYGFVLKGFGTRVGYQVPVPGLKAVGNQDAVPSGRQWTTGNIIVGNMMGGIPVFFCAWELHYMVAGPLKAAKAPTPDNPALHILANAELPVAVLLPVRPPTTTPMDQAAQQQTTQDQAPPTFLNPLGS